MRCDMNVPVRHHVSTVAVSKQLWTFVKHWSIRRRWNCNCGWNNRRHSTRHRYKHHYQPDCSCVWPVACHILMTIMRRIQPQSGFGDTASVKSSDVKQDYSFETKTKLSRWRPEFW